MKVMVCILALIICVSLSAQSIIDITVKGISDSKKDGAQKDRLEAILDAKKQACEKAGIKLESKTMVENFKTVYDYVETQSKGVLLPGFQIVDVGYVKDGTYQVVLSGKIKKLDEEKIMSKELRYAKSLNDRGKSSQCKEILYKYIDSKDEKVSEELKEQSLYYLMKWGYTRDISEQYEKFAAYYPESKYLNTLKSFSGFSGKPLYKQEKIFNLKKSKWKKKKFTHENKNFNKQISIVKDTIILKDFKNKEHSLIVNYTYYLNDNEKAEFPVGYYMKMFYYTINIKKAVKKKEKIPEPKTVDDNFRTYSKNQAKSFELHASDKWFGNFRLYNFALKGNFPVGPEVYEQMVRFTISQRSF